MKKGDIVQSKKHKDQLGVCTTNEMPSGFIGVLHYSRGKEEARLLSKTERWNVIEFADGRINEALFPKNEEAEQRRFEEEFYYNEIPIGQPIRAGQIHFDHDRYRGLVRRWAREQNIADRPIERVYDDIGF